MDRLHLDPFKGKMVKKDTTVKTIYNKEKITNKCSMKYYYPDPNDMKSVDEGGLNLPSGRRPWYSFKKIFDIKDQYGQNEKVTEIKTGREAFNDPVLYKPIQMKNYIESIFIEPYIKIDRPSPFVFREGIEKNKKFDLNSQQKFCGQFINFDTDFPGILVYHGIGSGKTITAITIAESFKNKYKAGDIFRDVSDRSVCVKNNIHTDCSVTFVVPMNLLDDYVKVITGKMQNGDFVSASGMCVIYCEDDTVNDIEMYRQFYQGKTTRDEDGNVKYINPNLDRITKLKNELDKIDNQISELQAQNASDISEAEKLKNSKKISELVKKQGELTIDYNNQEKALNSNIQDIYFIVSQETFISRLQSEDKTASKFVLGKNPHFITGKGSYIGTNPISYDCLHSNKSLLIIDEIQRLVTEKGSRHFVLYNTLFMHARSFIDGNPTMKVVLLTATPIHNIPFQMASMINLLRPRLMFTRKLKEYNDWFIDKNKNEMKNKLLHSYMLSGYVSYFKGGDPSGYPYRKNIVKLHKMGSVQYNQYKDQLKLDIDIMKKEKVNAKQNMEENGYIDTTNSKNIYRNSTNICLCAFPDAKGVNPKEQLIQVIRSGKFGEYSSKLASIGDQIMKSEGPVFVFSGSIVRGLYPLTLYMETKHKMTFIGRNDEYKQKASTLLAKNKLRYAIWSNSLYSKYYNVNEKESVFRVKINNLFNDSLNKDGMVCKVIFGNITEGVSFLRVKEMHLLEPWWNESKMEQIIGRCIRYMSHADLPVDQQYINVYYHCSVLATYPEKDESLDSIVGNKTKICPHCRAQKIVQDKYVDKQVKVNVKQQKEKKEGKKSVYVDKDEELIEEDKYVNPDCTCDQLNKDVKKNATGLEIFNSISIEQKIFILAKIKNKINKDFEMNLKESAVDYELNKNGNISRLEEMSFPSLRMSSNEKLLYDRSTNLYYAYKKDEKDAKLYNIDVNKNITTVWPPNEYAIKAPLENSDELIKKIEFNNHGEEMVHAYINEKIESFINNPEYNTKNFYELKKYAIEQKGEEEKVWNGVENYYKLNELITLLYKNNINPEFNNYKGFIKM